MAPLQGDDGVQEETAEPIDLLQRKRTEAENKKIELESAS